jgi:hypothetical protein
MTEGEDIACIDVGLCQPPVSYGFVEESSGRAAVASSHGRQMVETDDVTHHTGVLTGVSLTAPAPVEPVGILVITAVRVSSIVKSAPVHEHRRYCRRHGQVAFPHQRRIILS